ncbi:hypothetical protein PSI15_14555 [Xenorhabdus sp. PR6a]|uniref:hypothetical protein n=1 Tax=Xenorhabdus sp. PR6a TaxID=3025877 RepID=UPI0023586731|nr:hypothetical protein [Xenorhabdus sp. PR6a]MDC9582771.1 hypothetical protein [Xenorhabdus sp. PR6a]
MKKTSTVFELMKNYHDEYDIRHERFKSVVRNKQCDEDVTKVAQKGLEITCKASKSTFKVYWLEKRVIQKRMSEGTIGFGELMDKGVVGKG